MANATEQLTEYEDGTAEGFLKISIQRRLAQAALMQAYPTIVFNAVEAHGYLMNWDTGPTSQFRTVAQNLAMEYGYNIIFSGFGFSGYFQGPLMVGGPPGQKIAKARGSLLAEGVLVTDTIAGARLYASHLFSYIEFDYGAFITKITNPGSDDPIIEIDPPEAVTEILEAMEKPWVDPDEPTV